MPYLFIGERRSARAIALGYTWEHGRLCAKTLREALLACGIDPAAQRYQNLFFDACEHAAAPLELSPTLVDDAVRAYRAGWQVVALGAIVHHALTALNIRHRCLTHPAALGSIRRRSAYQAHVAAVLTAAWKEPV